MQGCGSRTATTATRAGEGRTPHQQARTSRRAETQERMRPDSGAVRGSPAAAARRDRTLRTNQHTEHAPDQQKRPPRQPRTRTHRPAPTRTPRDTTPRQTEPTAANDRKLPRRPQPGDRRAHIQKRSTRLFVRAGRYPKMRTASASAAATMASGVASGTATVPKHAHWSSGWSPIRVQPSSKSVIAHQCPATWKRTPQP